MGDQWVVMFESLDECKPSHASKMYAENMECLVGVNLQKSSPRLGNLFCESEDSVRVSLSDKYLSLKE